MVDRKARTVGVGDREVRVRHYPIAVDGEATMRALQSEAGGLARRELLALAGGRRLIVRVDRFDPSKNILRGFQAFETMLSSDPEWGGRVCFVAILPPTRVHLPEYQAYRSEVLEEVARINATYRSDGVEPIRLYLDHNYVRGLAALSVADVVLINSLVDGMNLVAKEAVIVGRRDAVVVLGETVGAYDQLKVGAVGVAPLDVGGTADALVSALTMPPHQKEFRMERMRDAVEREGLLWWFGEQMGDLEELRLDVTTH